MFCFDLETAADESAIEFLPEPEAPANYKSEEAIAKYKAEAKAKTIEKMALVPAYCRIIAIGTCYDGTLSVTVCPDEEVEAKTLTRFWDSWQNHAGLPVGYNIIGFDLPVLITRSRILGIPHPKPQLRKYGSPDVRDLMLELSFGGLNDYKSLSFWVKRLKLDVPPDRSSGKDMADFLAAGDWHSIAQHCELDCMATLALAQYLDRL